MILKLHQPSPLRPLPPHRRRGAPPSPPPRTPSSRSSFSLGPTSSGTSPPHVRQMVAKVAEEEKEGVRYLLRCLKILVLIKGGKLMQEPEELVRLLE